MVKRIETDTCVFFVGQNARENWKLLDESEPDDLFVHAAGAPSCYVIVVSRPRHNTAPIFSIEDIRYACTLCKSHSSNALKTEEQIEVLYVPVRNVRKGRTAGQVRITTHDIHETRHILRV